MTGPAADLTLAIEGFVGSVLSLGPFALVVAVGLVSILFVYGLRR